MRAELRHTFNQEARRYARARPGYPAALFTGLAALAPVDGRVLEIGPGTGQATTELAERATDLTALDLGAELIAVLRERLPRPRPGARLQFDVCDFERWPLPVEPFDPV